MSLNEFITFVSLVCNFHSTELPRTIKEQCMEAWVNCAVREDDRVDRMRLNSCLEKVKKDSKNWRE
jgi:hypothetical protein